MKALLHNPEGDSEASKRQRTPAQWHSFVNTLTDAEARALLHEWGFWSRPKQRAPKWRWFTWLILAGRGFGKTRTAAAYVREEVEAGRAGRVAIVGATVSDARDVMIDGESGLLAQFPKGRRPVYVPSKRLVRFHNGAIARTYSAEKPEQLRGPQHDLAWCDEPAVYRDLDKLWKILVPALRYGKAPRVVMTTTPKPLPLFEKLLNDKSTAYTNGTTYENTANIPEATLARIKDIYEGTDLGDQEIGGKLLGQNPGALWRAEWLNVHRVDCIPCEVKRKIVVIDPSSSAKDEACEVGMVVLYLGVDGKVYVVEDLSCRDTPAGWIAKAAEARKRHGAASILYEGNHGGGFIVDLFRIIARDETRYLRAVYAVDDKPTRAQPVSALTQKGFVRMVGRHVKLEGQLTTWVPGTGKSPDRVDALVHGVTDLAIGPMPSTARREDPFMYAA
jgi:phage terminase large subunit-like protein